MLSLTSILLWQGRLDGNGTHLHTRRTGGHLQRPVQPRLLRALGGRLPAGLRQRRGVAGAGQFVRAPGGDRAAADPRHHDRRRLDSPAPPRAADTRVAAWRDAGRADDAREARRDRDRHAPTAAGGPGRRARQSAAAVRHLGPRSRMPAPAAAPGRGCRSRMKLGFAVKVLGDGGLPSHDTRRWQSNPHLSVSIERLHSVFDYLDRNDIRMYRRASSPVPYATHPALPQFHRQLSECADELGELGARAKALDIRLSFHPGQYCVLNSQRPEVVDGALRDLESHAQLLELMDQPAEAVVVLHVGGRGDDHAAACDRFVAGFGRLSERARSRLVLENDDRLFGLGDVLRLSSRTGVRVVWDAHHHACHNPDRIPEREALRLALGTWPKAVVPKLHYSSSRTALGERRLKRGRRVVRVPALPPRSAHADLIDPFAFDRFLRETVRSARVDVMLEAKAKDLALLRLRDELASLRSPPRLRAAA